jgi:hypothetical protein
MDVGVLEWAHELRSRGGSVVKLAAGEADPAGVGCCRLP